MEFLDRVKKEMSEGVVKAMLEDAGYRVIDSGIEKVLRELSCMSAIDYRNLRFPDAMRYLPDFTVMDIAQTMKVLVDVKYRKEWTFKLFEEVAPQLRIFGELSLIVVNAAPPLQVGWPVYPSAFIRVLDLRVDGGVECVKVRQDGGASEKWIPFEQARQRDSSFWWATQPLSHKFPNIPERDSDGSLQAAVKAISGIIGR